MLTAEILFSMPNRCAYLILSERQEFQGMEDFISLKVLHKVIQ